MKIRAGDGTPTRGRSRNTDTRPAGVEVPVGAPEHFGPGIARAIYGQRVRVNRLTASARAALPEGVREVLLVPWDYGADCRPVPWSRSAGWLPDTLTGVFAATLRAREHWAGDLPTLDITPFAQPYREPPADTSVRDWLPTRRLGIDRLLRLYDALWPIDTPLDTVTALAGGEHTWPADLDDRLFPSLLTPSEHAQWQTDVQAANEAARPSGSARARRANVRPLPRPMCSDIACGSPAMRRDPCVWRARWTCRSGRS
jgi:hypothetical protein